MRLHVQFVVGNITQARLEDILSTNLDKDYPYWLGGPINWPLQTYLVLRQYRENVSIGIESQKDAINIGHVKGWRSLGPRKDEYRVSVRADYRRLFDVDFEILQNPMAVHSSKQIYLPYWPIPRILARDKSRRGVKVIAYAGRPGPRNLVKDFQANVMDLLQGNTTFRQISKELWHDMREVDVLLAIRSFDYNPYNNKPPSKLINAWHAGIPLIGGWDSAFSKIGTPGIDYIRVSNKSDLISELQKLSDDHKYYDNFVENGLIRAKQYTKQKIAIMWINAIDGPISTDAMEFFNNRFLRRMESNICSIADVSLGIVSNLKLKLKKVFDRES